MKKCRVKIWGSPLTCPVCEQDIFYFRKVAITDQDEPDSQKLGYLFECARCGYGSLFSGDRVATYEAALSSPPVQHRMAVKKESLNEKV